MGFMPALAIGAQVFGTGISIFGAIQEGRAKQDAANFNAGIQRNNAIIARRQAGFELEAGELRAGDLAEQGRFLGGKAMVAAAGNGVRVGDGSSIDISSDIRARALRNISRTRRGATLAASGQLARAANFESQATLDEFQGEAAAKAGQIKALSSLASGAGSVATSWHAFATKIDP